MASIHDYDDEATIERLKHRVTSRTKARPSKGKGHRLRARMYAWQVRRSTKREG